MKRKGISQEGLKVIACLTMLLDHVGAVLVPGVGLRVVGRLAFPIYCFLLAEGAARTGNPRRYGLRLAVGMVLSEAPFDLALFGGLTARHQSVMVTMLLGYLAVCAMKRCGGVLKLAAALPFLLAADWLRTDYGGLGVAMIVMFALVREMPWRPLWQTLWLGILCWAIGGMTVAVGQVRVPIELFGVLAMVPIGLYHGEKRTHSKAVQWGFYLFYPVHLTVLWLLSM